MKGNKLMGQRKITVFRMMMMKMVLMMMMMTTLPCLQSTSLHTTIPGSKHSRIPEPQLTYDRT
jgi:hypothetical protein